jgi:Ca2+-binding EF-hand superfamily protein
MTHLRRALLTVGLAALSLAGSACQGNLSEDETLSGEAASALMAAEESGDVTADAAGAESIEVLSAQAEASAALPSLPDDAAGTCDFSAHRQRVLARYDADADGKLNAPERRALKADLETRFGSPLAVRFGLAHRAHVVRRAQWLFDENGDGQLSSDERTAMVDAFEARCRQVHARVLERFDADGSGKLEQTERQAAFEALRARVQAHRQTLLSEYDSNTNGVLDDGERLALRADRLAAFQTRRAALIEQFDANGDGTLGAVEVRALKQAIITRLIEGRDAE